MVSKGGFFGVVFLLFAYYYAYGRRGGNGGKILGPIVETSSGKIQGIVSVTRDGNQFHEFLGIPFATAERFQTPKPVEKWEGVRDGSSYGPVCAQLELFSSVYKGSEDCLFLNIHVPKNIEKGQRLPVLFWIHGGYFMAGSSNQYLPGYFLDQNVVLVTINYRLGALGFLSTGDDLVRGNMGLKDQTVALKWTKQNIAKFGGDPKNIVLFGESAGGASAHLHMTSPMSRGLMSKVISQSGTAINPWTLYTEDLKSQAQNFAQQFNCPTQNTKEMVTCLQKVTVEELVQGHREGVTLFRKKVNIFVPTIEKVIDEETFLPEHPAKLINSGKYSKLPWLTGFLSAEGLLSSHNFLKNETFRSDVNTNFGSLLESFVQLTPEQISEHGEKIRDFYFGQNGGRLDSVEVFPQVTNLIGDRLWVVSGVEAARLQAAHSSVYLYYYSKKGPSLFNLLVAVERKWPLVVEILLSRAKNFVKNIFGSAQPHYGACHADELAMLFEMPNLFSVGRDDPDAQFSRDMVRLWVEFAYDDTKMEFRGHKFLKLEPKENLKYFQIDDDAGMKGGDERILNVLKFWNGLKMN